MFCARRVFRILGPARPGGENFHDASVWLDWSDTLPESADFSRTMADAANEACLEGFRVHELLTRSDQCSSVAHHGNCIDRHESIHGTIAFILVLVSNTILCRRRLPLLAGYAHEPAST